MRATRKRQVTSLDVSLGRMTSPNVVPVPTKRGPILAPVLHPGGSSCVLGETGVGFPSALVPGEDDRRFLTPADRFDVCDK